VLAHTTSGRSDKDPLKRAHHIGTSVVITIDQCHVARLGIDDMTFFVQRPIENGILLEMRKFDVNWDQHNDRNKTE
jgi:hypothetical protein